MKLAAHGIELTLPPGWSGRMFSRAHGLLTVHAGDFPLALTDGEFGDGSTGRMPGAATFLALTEYRPGGGLVPGAGLFASRRKPRSLDPTAFSSRGLAHHRPGQAGLQRFFTAEGRPFCLYVVLAGPRHEWRPRLAALDAVLGTLVVARRHPEGAVSPTPR